MASVKDNVMTRGFSGTIARLLTFRQKAGKTIVSKLRRPVTGEPSEKAAAVRVRFASSIKYAKAAIKNPATKALYKAKASDGQTAFNVAMADAFIAPVIENVEATEYHGIVGDAISIRATDNFKVANVSVSIHNATGDLVEQGNAIVQENEVDWLYKATQANPAIAGSKITAVATDLPGNSVSLDKIL